MKIGYITSHDVNNINAWSGTIYFTYKVLCRFYGESNVLVCKKNSNKKKIVEWLLKKISKWYTRLGYTLHSHTMIRSYLYSFLYEKNELDTYDLLFAPAASIEIAYLKTKTPIVYISDATFDLMIDYYPEFSGLNKREKWEGNRIERKALQNATYFIATSGWTATSAITEYKITSSKVYTVPLGACLPIDIELETGDIDPKNIRLLFLGVDWERKGGQIAVDCCRLLIEKGYPASLNIVGIDHLNHLVSQLDFVKNYGRLYKSDFQQLNLLYQILFDSDFLLLPTRAECAGLVFCEASAFGLPSLTYNTGGIPDYILEGVNGYKLPLTAGPLEFADKIIGIVESGIYNHLSENCITLYKQKLNWDHWVREFDKIIKNISGNLTQ